MTGESGKGSTFRVGLIQTRSGRSPAANLEAVVKLIGEAKEGGACYVQTPEMTNIMEVSRDKLLAAITPEENDASLAMFRELARKFSIYLHIGSLAVKATPDKAANRSFLIDPHGEIAARYDKIHMFDVDLANGESYRESRSYRPGELAVLHDLPWGRLGLTICYDLRFPAFSRNRWDTENAGGPDFDLLIYVANWPDARAYAWQTLLRARAIENVCYVAGVNRVGSDGNGLHYAGDSAVLDFMGSPISECADREVVTTTTLQAAELQAFRARFTALQDGDRVAWD